MNKTKTTISKNMNSTNKTKSDNMNSTLSGEGTKTSQLGVAKLPLQQSLYSMYVHIRSKDNRSFYVPIKVAEGSVKLKAQIKDIQLQISMKQAGVGGTHTVQDKNKNTNAPRSNKNVPNILVSNQNDKKENEKTINSGSSVDLVTTSTSSIIEVPMINFSGEVVESFVDYLNYKYFYENIKIPDNMKQLAPFEFRNEIALDVLILSNEYGC